MSSSRSPLAFDAAIPSYNDSTLNDDGHADESASLPAYSGPVPTAQRQREMTPRRPKDFDYKLVRGERTWAKMTITADGRLSKTIPTFVDGEPIQGQVELCTEKSGDDIRAVVVTVIGEVIMGANKGEQFTFVNVAKTLWSQEMGDPNRLHNLSSHTDSGPTESMRHQREARITTNLNPVPAKFTKRLVGDYVWKFELKLPKEVVLKNGNETGTFRLLQSQSERYTRACVQYEVSVRFLRGKLRSDNKIGAFIGYIPIIYPPPLPPLRRLSYQEGLSNLLGPDADTEGWHSERPIRIKGKIFNNREVDISCQLHLAKPLSYTRGTTIPLHLTLEGGDTQALDLLSNPKAPVVRLRRRIKSGVLAVKDLHHYMGSLDGISLSEAAVWWHAPEQAENPRDGRRTINGELHLKTELKPTSAMAQFRIEYDVVLFPSDVIGFDSLSSEPLLECAVEIVTAYATGPKPRMLTPPGYNHNTLHQTERSNLLVPDMGFM